MRLHNIIRAVLFTAVVFVATIILQIYTPATRGYFNLGETAIYTIAAISSPVIAGFAGGVGSAIADIVTGYGGFAPGTLIIKFTEGFVVAYLIKKLGEGVKGIRLAKGLSIATSIIAGILVAYIGYHTLSGVVELTSIPVNIAGFEIIAFAGEVNLSGVIWIALGCVVTISLLYASLIKGKESATAAASMLVGGLIMVMGYFLYEYFISNPLIYGEPPQQAIFEVPVNLGQALVGLSIGLTMSAYVREAAGIAKSRSVEAESNPR